MLPVCRLAYYALNTKPAEFQHCIKLRFKIVLSGSYLAEHVNLSAGRMPPGCAHVHLVTQSSEN